MQRVRHQRSIVHPDPCAPRACDHELGSPSSGIYTPLKKSKFRGMPSYEREYRYKCGRRCYFGGGVLFFNGEMAFSVSWSAPEDQKEWIGGIFAKMLESLAVRESYATIRRKRAVGKKMREMAAVGGIKET